VTPREISYTIHSILGLDSAQGALLLEVEQSSISKIGSPEDSPAHRPAPVRFLRLLEAYRSGYRPPDWPAKLLAEEKEFRLVARERGEEEALRGWVCHKSLGVKQLSALSEVLHHGTAPRWHAPRLAEAKVARKVFSESSGGAWISSPHDKYRKVMAATDLGKLVMRYARAHP